MPDEKTYEERDLRPKVVGVFAGSLVALTIFTLLAMGWLLRVFSPTQAKPPPIVSEPEPLRPGPKLQVSPARELSELRAMEDLQLHSYRWVDAEAGIASIPIERAMDLIAKRGLPVHESTDQPNAEKKQ
jgi:hypothetical protein